MQWCNICIVCLALCVTDAFAHLFTHLLRVHLSLSQETDSFDWALDKLPEAQFSCLVAAVRAVNMTSSADANVTSSHAERSELVLRSVEAARRVCPLLCSFQGVCGDDGVCTCNAGEQRVRRK